MKPGFRRRIEPILRDIRPVRPIRQAEGKQARGEPVRERRIRFPQKLIRPLFVVALITLILAVSLFSVRSLFQDGGQASFGELKDLVGAIIGVTSNINKLKAEGFNLVLNGRGEEFIAILKDLQANVAKLDALGVGFIDESTLGTVSDGLDALITLLGKPGEQRLLVLFLNPSEMRPIGGFAGSYGEIVFTRGSIKEIKVNDIYYPDRFLVKKIVPPRQLQSVTVDWGARDAAWFFNFPDSARKTVELLEASEIYSKNNTQFDGVIALNVRVIEDILEITGPIKLPEYDLTLTKDNFLEEIQQEVEAGRDKEVGENPKRVLSALAPILVERLNQLDSSDKNTLALVLLMRAANKDIQFYFDDPKVEDFVKHIGWGGVIADLPQDFSGDYLAVINTNVAGGKTDAKIGQTIKLKSEIDENGRVNNYLALTRRHFGKAGDAPWYQAKNQNFVKIFTAPNAELISLKGITPKNVNPQIDYLASGYSIDSLLELVERTQKEAGRSVFAAWFSISPGESRTLEASYKGNQLPLRDNLRYRFIFDKQSGVESAFEYELVAPPGYKWRESNGSTFAYKSDTIPARLEFELTLIRN